MSRFFAKAGLAAAIVVGAAAASARADEDKSFTLDPQLISSDASDRRALALEFALEKEWRGRAGHLALAASGMRSFDEDVKAARPMKAALEGGLTLFDPVDCRQFSVPSQAGSQAPPAIPQPSATDAAAASDGVVVPPEGEGPKRSCPWGYTTLGLALGGEADEEFDNRAHRYGLVFRTQLPRWATLELGYGEVDPKEDDEREKILGRLETFDRAHAEFSLAASVGRLLGTPVKVAYTYRYYREINADPAIKAANLHRSRLASGRVMFLPKGDKGIAKFVGYTTGRLPFGVEDDSVLEAGLELKIF